MVSGRSAARATWYGLPLSSDSSCASSSVCFSIRSASLFIKTPRCEAPILRHAPLSNAARAAATALSTSAASASATCVITSPVDGLIVGKVFPETLSTHFPLISSFVGPILTFRSNTVVAVAILNSSFDAALPEGGCGARPLKPRQASMLRGRSLYPSVPRGKMVGKTRLAALLACLPAPASCGSDILSSYYEAREQDGCGCVGPWRRHRDGNGGGDEGAALEATVEGTASGKCSAGHDA